MGIYNNNNMAIKNEVGRGLCIFILKNRINIGVFLFLLFAVLFGWYGIMMMGNHLLVGEEKNGLSSCGTQANSSIHISMQGTTALSTKKAILLGKVYIIRQHTAI